MKILFLGDVVGRSGRKAISEKLPKVRDALKLDFVIVNGENASNGMGLNAAHSKLILEAGADCVTLGDHAFDQKEMLSHIESDQRIIRPMNIARSAPGQGFRVFHPANGMKVLVVQVLGQVFMKQPYADPFSALDSVLNKFKMGAAVDAVIVDFHAEATSEKMAVAHWCDGRASLVVGTHTHVPTSDTRILAGGTAAQSDAGMCGDYDSVIGMDKLEPMRRFVTGMPKARFTPAEGEATLSGVVVETDNATGKALKVEPFRLGGGLQPTHQI